MTDTTLKDWYMRYAPRSPLPAPRSPLPAPPAWSVGSRETEAVRCPEPPRRSP